jgi:GMP synthase-like glutamine amidotransferase
VFHPGQVLHAASASSGPPILRRIDTSPIGFLVIDKLIITGGDDSVLRRTVEIKLAAAMMQRNKPVIGICHGAFLLTDLLGGEVEEVDAHRDTKHPVFYFGDIKIVNSFHSLGINKLHSSGTVLCTDELGYVEAFIDGKLAGVVWHPERMDTPWLPDEIEDLLSI